MLAHATGFRTRRPRGGGGFTLIELVVLIIIVGILAATAVPALDSINDNRLGMAGKQLARDLAYARQHAAATGTTTWVVFDTAAETWSLLEEDPASPGRVGATAMTDPATGGGTFVQTLDADSFAGVQIVTAAFDGDVEVGFDWLGEPYNAAETALAADGVVTLTGGHTVTVKNLSGLSYHTAP